MEQDMKDEKVILGGWTSDGTTQPTGLPDIDTFTQRLQHAEDGHYLPTDLMRMVDVADDWRDQYADGTLVLEDGTRFQRDGARHITWTCTHVPADRNKIQT